MSLTLFIYILKNPKKKINHHSIYTEHPSQHYFQPYKKATDVIVCDSKVILNYPRLRNKNAPAAAIARAPIPAKIPALFASPVCGIEAFLAELAVACFSAAFLLETVAWWLALTALAATLALLFTPLLLTAFLLDAREKVLEILNKDEEPQPETED